MYNFAETVILLKFSEYNFSEATSAEIKKRFPSNKYLKKTTSAQHCAKVILEIVRNSDDRYVFVLEE